MTEKKVSQDNLRQMMQKMRAEKGESTATGSDRKRKYKLGAKELALMEVEKKRKTEELKEEKRTQAKNAGVPENFFDSAKTKAFLSLKQAPKKSILKNSSAPAKTAKSANEKATGQEWTSRAPVLTVSPKNKEKSPKDKSPSNPHTLLRTPSGGVISHLKDDSEEMKVAGDVSENTDIRVEDSEKDKSLPEGFFDDPVKDAKARGIEYKNPEDMEWEAFQKEIAVEVSASVELAAEDQLEETTERQLEEIDEQMRAWDRVRQAEIRRDAVEEQLQGKKTILDSVEIKEEDEEVDEAEMEEFLDWRLKKS